MKPTELRSVLKDLYEISGFRVSLHDTDFREIAAYPEKKLPFCAFLHERSGEELDRCAECDRRAAEEARREGEAMIYTCRHGLTEAISPLYNFGTLTGFLMMGQVATEGADRRPMEKAAARLSRDGEEYRAILDTIPAVPKERIETFVRIMTVCAEYLTLSNAVPGVKPTVGQLTKQYINENFASKIVIPDICRALGYSKSTLLTAFKREYGITVVDYLTEVRVGAAKKMLRDRKKSVSDVAAECGFCDQSYFSKVFSAACGMTPSEFRRQEGVFEL